MRTKTYLLIISLIFLLYLVPLFHSGIFLSHDSENHIARFGAYIKAFADGQIPPRWAGDLNFRYGSPLFIFFYPLPGYIASFLYLLHFDLQTIFKIIAGVSFILAPIFFFLWTKNVYEKKYAFIAALFFGLAPYHFLDLYVRGDIGEVVSFVFVPGVFWMIEKNIKKIELTSIIYGGFFYAFLILSHNIISLIFSFIFLGYILMGTRKIKNIISQIAILVIGLSASSFFWIPALAERKYLNTHIFLKDWYSQQFPTFSQLIYSPWGFGSDVGKNGGLSPQIGILHILIILASIYFLIKTKKENRTYWFWTIAFIVSLIFATSVSNMVWSRISLLQQFQFPWKFVVLASFSSAVLSGFVLKSINNKVVYTVILMALLLSSVTYMKVSRYIDKPDSYYFNFKGSTYFHNEATTVWVAEEPSKVPNKKIEILEGDGKTKIQHLSSSKHIFSLSNSSEVLVRDNTLFYPGWIVKDNNQLVPVQFQDPQSRGILTFRIPPGEHTIEVSFIETRMRKIANFVSLTVVSILLSLLIFVYSKRILRR